MQLIFHFSLHSLQLEVWSYIALIRITQYINRCKFGSFNVNLTCASEYIA